MTPAPLTAQCDGCQRGDHAKPPATLPKGWTSDPYTGRTLCPRCQERDAVVESSEDVKHG